MRKIKAKRLKLLRPAFVTSLFLMACCPWQLGTAQLSTNTPSLEACLDLAETEPDKAFALAEAFSIEDSEASWLCRAATHSAKAEYRQAGLIFADRAKANPDKFRKALLSEQAAKAFASEPQNQELASALEWATTWAQLDEKNIESHLLLADLKTRNSNQTDPNFSSALGHALQAQLIAEDGDRARVLAITASIRMRAGDYTTAQQDLFQALQRTPDDPTSLFVLGRWLLDQDRTLEAEEVWLRLAEHNDPAWQQAAKQELLRFEN